MKQLTLKTKIQISHVKKLPFQMNFKFKNKNLMLN